MIVRSLLPLLPLLLLPAALAVDPWDAVRAVVDAADQRDVLLYVGDATGLLLEHQKGRGVTPDEAVSIASASKWVAASAIMSVVERGALRLDARASDYFSFWTSDEADQRSRVTLQHLLSFTSGLGEEAQCTGNDEVAHLACVEEIYNDGVDAEPGTEFYYSSDHLAVAGLMAAQAAGFDDWNEFFADEILSVLGIPLAEFATGPPNNPRVAGGMATEPRHLLAWMQAYYANELVTPATQALMEADWTPADSVTIVSSPISQVERFGDPREFHYGLGLWYQCTTEPFDEDLCYPQKVFSSPGLFGTIPLIDRATDYYVVMVQARYLDLFASHKAVLLMDDIQAAIVEALAEVRGDNPGDDDDNESPAGAPTVGPITIFALLANLFQ